MTAAATRSRSALPADLARAACDPATPEARLVQLANEHPELKGLLARNPNYPLAGLWRLAEAEPRAVLANPAWRFALASGEPLYDVDDPVLTLFNEAPEGLMIAASLPEAPIALVERAASVATSAPAVQHLLANPRLPPEMVQDLACDAPQRWPRVDFAEGLLDTLHNHVAFPDRHPEWFSQWDAPIDLLRLLRARRQWLWTSDDFVGLEHAAVLEWLDVDALAALYAIHGGDRVAGAALLMHPRAEWSSEVYDRVSPFAQDRISRLRNGSRASSYREDALRELQAAFHLADPLALLIAAHQPHHLPASMVERLAHHRWSAVRGVLAQHPQTPAPCRSQLRQDPDARVRALARAKPSPVWVSIKAST